MSFCPLPKTFLERLRAARPCRIVEIGAGDGGFAAVLGGHGASPWRIDRRPPWTGSAAQVVGDARELPLGEGTVDLLIAANLLRHVWPPPRGEAVPAEWLRCLAAGGKLYIFEDEPTARPRAARNYRDLQDFLAAVDPATRRPLLPRARFLARAAPGRTGSRWEWGVHPNLQPVRSPDSVIAWLRGGGGEAEGQAQRLAAAIARHGLAYGDYWWACWTAEGGR